MKDLIRRMENLVPHLSRAADMAGEEDRDGDAAPLGASVNLFQSIAAALHNDEGPDPAPEVAVAAPAAAAAAPAKHRHKYGADGACAELVEGKVCGAVSRAAKKAAATAPAAPATGGSAP